MSPLVPYADTVDVSGFDPGFQMWWALMWDIWHEDKEAGMDILIGYVSKVMVESGRWCA